MQCGDRKSLNRSCNAFHVTLIEWCRFHLWFSFHCWFCLTLFYCFALFFAIINRFRSQFTQYCITRYYILPIQFFFRVKLETIDPLLLILIEFFTFHLLNMWNSFDWRTLLKKKTIAKTHLFLCTNSANSTQQHVHLWLFAS